MRLVIPCDDYFFRPRADPRARIEDAAQPLAGVWGRARDAPAQHHATIMAMKKNKIHPPLAPRAVTSFVISTACVVQRHGRVGIPPVVVGGTKCLSNLTFCGLYLAGFTHDDASCWLG